MHGISPGCFAHSAARCTLRTVARVGILSAVTGHAAATVWCHVASCPVTGTATWSHRYTDEHSDLLNGVHGRVYLDTQQPRVCIRGPEVLYIASVADSAQSTPL